MRSLTDATIVAAIVAGGGVVDLEAFLGEYAR